MERTFWVAFRARKGKWRLHFKATASNPALNFDEEFLPFDKECAILFPDFISYGNLVLRDLLFRWAGVGEHREVFCSDRVSSKALGAARPNLHAFGGELAHPFYDRTSCKAQLLLEHNLRGRIQSP